MALKMRAVAMGWRPSSAGHAFGEFADDVGRDAHDAHDGCDHGGHEAGDDEDGHCRAELAPDRVDHGVARDDCAAADGDDQNVGAEA